MLLLLHASGVVVYFVVLLISSFVLLLTVSFSFGCNTNATVAVVAVVIGVYGDGDDGLKITEDCRCNERVFWQIFMKTHKGL